MAFSALNKFVVSAEVWLNKRIRARHDRRRCHSYMNHNEGIKILLVESNGCALTPSTKVRSEGSDVTRRSRAIRASTLQLLLICARNRR